VIFKEIMTSLYKNMKLKLGHTKIQATLKCLVENRLLMFGCCGMPWL
jgi:hypothetical protein